MNPREYLAESNPEALLVDGHDNAIVGVGTSFEISARAVYSVPKIIENLMEDGMSEEEAWEYFGYNIEGAYCGSEMPIFLMPSSSELL